LNFVIQIKRQAVLADQFLHMLPLHTYFLGHGNKFSYIILGLTKKGI